MSLPMDHESTEAKPVQTTTVVLLGAPVGTLTVGTGAASDSRLLGSFPPTGLM